MILLPPMSETAPKCTSKLNLLDLQCLLYIGVGDVAIINQADKSRKLPSLNKSLGEYHSSFFFGGQLTYGNIKGYLISNGFNIVKDEEDYSHLPSGSLGVHDEYMFREFKKELAGEDIFKEFQRFVIFRTIDQKWKEHLHAMDQLREGINLRAYGQKNPLIEYKHEGFAMFESMMLETNKETLKRIFRTNLSNVGVQSMQPESKTRNLQTKKNQDILSGLTAPPPQQTSQNAPSFPGAPPQPIVPNQKKEPIKAEKKIGRNEPCPCGSGKKYKKCCA